MIQQKRERFPGSCEFADQQVEVPQVTLNSRRCLRVAAFRGSFPGTADEVPRIVELAVEESHDPAVEKDRPRKPRIWREPKNALSDITMTARLVESPCLSFKHRDGVVKAGRGLARSRTLNDTSHIWKTSQNIDDGPSINEQSKQVEVSPGKEVSVVGFLRKMGCTLSMLECPVLISTSPTHYREGRLGLCSNTRRGWCLSIELCKTLRFV
jgi:hypothetical protein